MGSVVRLRNWQQRVYRCAARLETMADATKFCRDNDVAVSPSTILMLNPSIKVKGKK